MEGVVLVKFIQMSPGCAGDHVLSPHPLAHLIVAIFNAICIGTTAIVVPVRVFDSSEAVEAPVNITCVRIVSACRSDQCVLGTERTGIGTERTGILLDASIASSYDCGKNGVAVV
jgi:hypothetical protein